MGRKQKNVMESLPVKAGGGGWLLVLLGLGVAAYFAVPALAGYLQKYAPTSGAPGGMELGVWAVVIVLVPFLAWCFSGSKGGRR